MLEDEDLLLAGEIGRPHGLRGEVYVVPISDDPRRFEPGSVLVHASGRELVVEHRRTHRADRMLVKFVGIDDRSAAEALRGALYVRAAERRQLEPGEFWHDDLVGCAVEVAGRRVGTVSAVIEGVAHDLLEVDTDRGPRLVPLVSAIVTGVDVGTRRITVDPPEGLLD